MKAALIFLALFALMGAAGPVSCTVSASAAALCIYYRENPPAKPGPVTKATYASLMVRCGQPLPTDEASAVAFIQPIVDAFLTARDAGR